MLLAIDIGNTDAVFAVFADETLAQTWRVKTALLADHEILKQGFTAQGLKYSEINDVIVSSVVPKADQPIHDFCQAVFGFAPITVNGQMAGVSIKIDKPDEVGSDRIVNVVAVLEHYQAPAIVIDFGTATTFDVINADGTYCGGAIAPGVNLSMVALHQAAAKLPSVAVKKPANVVGRDTVSAMQSGIFWGYVGLAEGMISRVSEEMQAKPFVIATGGLATLFADSIPVIDVVDHDLTIKGLLKIYQNHKKQAA